MEKINNPFLRRRMRKLMGCLMLFMRRTLVYYETHDRASLQIHNP